MEGFRLPASSFPARIHNGEILRYLRGCYGRILRAPLPADCVRITWRNITRMARALRCDGRSSASERENFVVIEEKCLRFATRAQCSFAPILGGVQEHCRPKPSC